MTITFRTDSILDTDAQALVNTVNCVGVMGKGLAKAVKERWPGVFSQYVTACCDGFLQPGNIFTSVTLPEVDWRLYPAEWTKEPHECYYGSFGASKSRHLHLLLGWRSSSMALGAIGKV